MSLVLNLPSALENKLAGEAARLGVPMNQYVLSLLAAETNGKPRIKTGKQLLNYWKAEGLVGTRPDIRDSQGHARALRKKAERRTRP